MAKSMHAELSTVILTEILRHESDARQSDGVTLSDLADEYAAVLLAPAVYQWRRSLGRGE